MHIEGVISVVAIGSVSSVFECGKLIWQARAVAYFLFKDDDGHWSVKYNQAFSIRYSLQVCVYRFTVRQFLESVCDMSDPGDSIAVSYISVSGYTSCCLLRNPAVISLDKVLSHRYHPPSRREADLHGGRPFHYQARQWLVGEAGVSRLWFVK